MIQRIQSVFLGIAAISSVLIFFFPLADFYDALNGNYRFFLYGMQCMDPHPKVEFGSFFTLPLIALTAASFIFSVSAIFMYKNRYLQLRLGSFNMITQIVLLALIFFFYANSIQSKTQIEPDYHYLGMCMPLIAIACLLLANRAIRKDEKLVKSAERIR